MNFSYKAGETSCVLQPQSWPYPGGWVRPQEMTGWIDLYVDRVVHIEMLVLGIASYAAVAVLEYRKISKVPMDEALKNAE